MLFRSGRHFQPGNATATDVRVGDQLVPFGTDILLQCDTMPELCVACEICEDIWVANTPSTAHALAGANVLVNLSASNETVGKDEYRELLVKSISARLLCGYLYTSSAEGESTQDLVFGGHRIIAENGTILKQEKNFQAGILYSELDLHRIAGERRRMSSFIPEEKQYYTRVHFSLKEEETTLTRTFESLPFVPRDKAKRDERCEEILSIQSYGLKKRLEHTGCQHAVIGVSGGLDSTLALLVTVRTFDMLGLDKKGILGVTMPCFGTTDRTFDNACRLVRQLGCTLQKVDIKKSVTQHFKDIKFDIENHDVTYENGQARERTQVLMDIANKENGMVIGTGDMSELALGWATYNGDHMSMYAVNASVPKTLVRHLVGYAAEQAHSTGQAALAGALEDILNTPVSPELLPATDDGCIAQVTEDLVGPYELHDFYLYYLLRLGARPRKLYRMARYALGGTYDDGTLLRWLEVFLRRFFAQQFKRSCLPDGPKIGSAALSPRGDWRMPSDASAALWLREAEALKQAQKEETV